MSQAPTTTLNGANTYQDSGSSLVDFFFSAGASRSAPESCIPLFEKALKQDPDTAVRILLHLRDVRQGQGERSVYRCLLKHLAKAEPETAKRLITKTAQLGRFDDILFAYADTPLEEVAYTYYLNELQNGTPSSRSLAAKWAPREKSANHRIARKLLRYSKLSPKAYRKLLSTTAKTVENRLCAKTLPGIDYSRVPSLASSRYQSAFSRIDPEGYSQYREALASGSAQVNTGAVYPYDIIKALHHGLPEVAQAQWDNLPDFCPPDITILPLVDVSESMRQPISLKSSTTARDVAVSLGIYLAQRQKTAFADTLLTFSSNPTLVSIENQNLEQAAKTVYSADWGFTTNIAKAFDQILSFAHTLKVGPEDMPKYLVIFSDMQFDKATSETSENPFLMDHLKTLYKQSGYDLPKIIFWNLVDYGSNTPVSFSHDGVALVSGFSPSLMKTLFQNPESFTPENVMQAAISSSRYDF